jgi:hypothetical protein
MCEVSLTEYKTYNSDDSVYYDFLAKSGPVHWFTGVESDIKQTRESVDAGSFEPGTFRINPYTHTSSTYLGGWGKSEVIIPRSAGRYQKKVAEGCIGSIAHKPEDFYPVFDTSFTKDCDLALQKAMAKVNAGVFQGGAELGELKETLSMLRKPFSGLERFLYKDNGRKQRLLQAVLRNYKRPGKFLVEFGKTVSDCWLEIRYGWRPLIYSIVQLMEECEKKRSKCENPPIKRARSNRPLTDSSYLSSNKSMGFRYFIDRDIRLTGTVRAIVYYRELLPRTAGQRFGYAYEFTPEVIFELTRLSFVLGWLFSVGPWLGSFRVKPGIDILGNTVSRRWNVDGVGKVKSNSDQYAHTYYGTDVTYSSESYVREVNRNQPNTPIFLGSGNLDLYKIVDSLTLAYEPINKACKFIRR